MGYTPDDQKFEEPINKIIKGIKEFDEVVDKRIDANRNGNEWSQNHINEIAELSTDLRRIKIRLVKLQSETR